MRCKTTSPAVVCHMKYSVEQTSRGINHFVSEYLGESFSLDLDKELHVYWELLAKEEICPFKRRCDSEMSLGVRTFRDLTLLTLAMTQTNATGESHRGGNRKF